MITMTPGMLEKIDLIDKLFGSMSVEQLREYTESEQIVARLKGVEENPGLLSKLVKENELHSLDSMNLRNELLVLKADMQSLIRALNQTVFAPAPQYNSDFNSLKSKHNVY